MTGPIGIIKAYASTMADPSSGIVVPPQGWLICDGRSYPKVDYFALYKNLLRNPSLPFNSSTNPLIYGGDSTNFNVPNLSNRFVRGWNPQSNPVIQVGQDVSESVKLDNISTQVDVASLAFGSNQPYSLTNVSVGLAGRHNHRYATSNATDTGRAELEPTQGFFHAKPEDESQETGQGYISHVRPADHGFTDGDPCNLHYGTQRMWSIAQSLGNSILENAVETEQTWNFRPFRSESLFGTGENGYPYSIPSIFEKQGNPTSRWRWGNTNFRHNHKYNLVTNSGGGHTHSISMSSTDPHTHTISSNPIITKVDSTSAKNNGEMRPSNTKLVYIIYSGIK